MKGGPFSTCGSRHSAALIIFKYAQELHGLRADHFLLSAALAPRTFVLSFVGISRIEGGQFSRCGYRAAHVLF
eukprot:5193042-Pyramimonas_sp.AAC.1